MIVKKFLALNLNHSYSLFVNFTNDDQTFWKGINNDFEIISNFVCAVHFIEYVRICVYDYTALVYQSHMKARNCFKCNSMHLQCSGCPKALDSQCILEADL